MELEDVLEDVVIVMMVVLLVLIAVIGLVIPMTISNTNYFEMDAVVVSKEVENGYTFFVLQDEDGIKNIYSNSDNWWYGKWNSGDYLFMLEVGKKYHFHIVGNRNNFYSLYKNIVFAELIK